MPRVGDWVQGPDGDHEAGSDAGGWTARWMRNAQGDSTTPAADQFTSDWGAFGVEDVFPYTLPPAPPDIRASHTTVGLSRDLNLIHHAWFYSPVLTRFEMPTAWSADPIPAPIPEVLWPPNAVAFEWENPAGTWLGGQRLHVGFGLQHYDSSVGPVSPGRIVEAPQNFGGAAPLGSHFPASPHYTHWQTRFQGDFQRTPFGDFPSSVEWEHPNPHAILLAMPEYAFGLRADQFESGTWGSKLQIRALRLARPPRHRFIFRGPGSWSARQRQTPSGNAGSWPVRQRQNGGPTGTWPVRQRQNGI